MVFAGSVLNVMTSTCVTAATCQTNMTSLTPSSDTTLRYLSGNIYYSQSLEVTELWWLDTVKSLVDWLSDWLTVGQINGQYTFNQIWEWVTQCDPWPKWPTELLTHDPYDSWPMSHRGRHPILALHRFIDYPTLYFDIVYVHNCACEQTAHTGTCKFRVC